jgi:hypothetical protein
MGVEFPHAEPSWPSTFITLSRCLRVVLTRLITCWPCAQPVTLSFIGASFGERLSTMAVEY